MHLIDPPKLETMKDGRKSIYLNAACSWNSFEQFGDELVSHVPNITVTKKTGSVCEHWWFFTYAGKELRMIYDEWPIEGVWLEGESQNDDAAVSSLWEEIQKLEFQYPYNKRL